MSPNTESLLQHENSFQQIWDKYGISSTCSNLISPTPNHVISDTPTEDGLSRGYLKEIYNCKYNAIKQNTSILIRVMVQYVTNFTQIVLFLSLMPQRMSYRYGESVN